MVYMTTKAGPEVEGVTVGMVLVVVAAINLA